MSRMSPTPEEVLVLVNLGKSDAEIGAHFFRSNKWCFKFRQKHGITSSFRRNKRNPPRTSAPKPKPTSLEELDIIVSKHAAGQHSFSCIGMRPGAEEKMAEFFRTRRYEDMKLKVKP